MKKFMIPAGLICSAAIAGTVIYKKVKRNSKDDIIFYPMGRYIIHTNDTFYDMKYLVNNADLIISGIVSGKSKARWNNKNNIQPKNVSSKDMIYIDYSIIPNKVLKGNATNHMELKVRTFEGFIGGYTVEDNSQIKLEEDQELILFLKNGDKKSFKYDEQAYYTVIGKLQGVFVKNDDLYENSYEKFGKEEIIQKINDFIDENITG